MNADKTEALLLISVYLRSSAAINTFSVPRKSRIRHFPRLLHQLHVETQRLQLANQNVERFGYARLDGGLALHDGLVNLGAAVDVVALRGQQFLQNVSRAIGFQRPDFHFATTSACAPMPSRLLLCPTSFTVIQ